MWVILALAAALGLAAAEECACTGSNAGIPNSSPHQGTNIGKYCSTWDVNTDICRKQNPPNWCAESWCYVQKDCTLNGEMEGDKISSYGEESQLFWSYKVCGSTDYFSGEFDDFTYKFEGCGEPRESPLDVYYLVDASGSINPTEWQQQMVFLSKILEHGMIVDGDRAGIAQWTGRMDEDFQLSEDIESIKAGVMDMEQMKGGTKTSLAIEYGINRLKKAGKKAGNQRLIMLLTDGVPDKNFGPCTDQKAKNMNLQSKLAEEDIMFAVLAIGNKDFKTALGCMVDDPEKNIVIMQDFDHFYEYRDPTGDNGVMCIDPNVFTEAEIPTMPPSVKPDVDNTCGSGNTCGCTCKAKGSTSKKHPQFDNRRLHVKVQDSCCCKEVCKQEGRKNFSFRPKKHAKGQKNCVCWDDRKEGVATFKASKSRKSQLMGSTELED